MPILIKIDSRAPDSRWEPMKDAAFSREDELQRLLWSDSADLIPADSSLDESHVVYAREMATTSGPIDLVGIGSGGSITVMECKLARNQQIKREVVGQVLDYAASLWGVDIDSLAGAFKASHGSDPFEALRNMTDAGGTSFDELACRAEVARRLADGDFRLVIAVDQIDADLRKIIKYVNSRAGSEGGLKLVALEFRRYEAGIAQLIVPETYGDELADAVRAPRELTEVQLLHLEYWTELREHLKRDGGSILLNTPKSSIATSHIAPSGFVFSAWNRMTTAGRELPPRPSGRKRSSDWREPIVRWLPTA